MATDTKEIEKKMAEASVSGDAIYTSEARGSDEVGEGTFKVPYKTIMQAMKRYGKEPFPVLYQDAKPDSEAAKEGEATAINRDTIFSSGWSTDGCIVCWQCSLMRSTKLNDL